MMSSADPFRRLAKLVVRAFYNEELPPRDMTKKPEKQYDNKGNAIVIVDALTRREWIKEDELARQLHLHPKQVRKTLRALQEERIIVREIRKENSKTVHQVKQAVAKEAGEALKEDKDSEEKIKQREYSYCTLDYGQMFDVVRFRLMKAKKKIKDEMEDKNIIEEYVCPSETCKQVYSALDVGKLMDPVTQSLLCSSCGAEVESVTRHLQTGPQGTQGESGGPSVPLASAMIEVDGDTGGDPRVRRVKLQQLLERMEVQLKPLTDQLAKLRDLPVPEYRSLVEWQQKAQPHQLAAAMGIMDAQKWSRGDESGSGGNLTGSSVPFVGETKVEVFIDDMDASLADQKAEVKKVKVLPQWAMRGVKQDATAGSFREVSEDVPETKKARVEVKAEPDEVLAEKERLEAYYKAYYEAQQRAVLAASGAETGVQDQVKHEPKTEPFGEEVEEDDIEWEEENGGGEEQGELQEGGNGAVKQSQDSLEVEEEDDVEWDEG